MPCPGSVVSAVVPLPVSAAEPVAAVDPALSSVFAVPVPVSATDGLPHAASGVPSHGSDPQAPTNNGAAIQSRSADATPAVDRRVRWPILWIVDAIEEVRSHWS